MRLGGVLAGMLLLTTLTSVARTAAPARAAGTVDVFVGYADSLRASATNFPTPWLGSPGMTFEGCFCIDDAGAVRIVNNTTATVTVNAVAVHVDTCTFTPWPAATLVPGAQLIVTQLSTGPANGCSNNSPPNFMDTSDVGPGGIGYSGNCTPDHIIPTVDVTVDGALTTFSDSGQVINTGGIDLASCPPGTNESTQWTPIGHAACPGSTLTLAPSSQTQTVGTPATVQATFANSCGTGLSGVSANFTVVSGPNAGFAGSVTTDANGVATFTDSNSLAGTDVLQASVTNTAGTITSNTVSVTWVAPISGKGQNVSATEGLSTGTVPVATFTDPDPNSQASEYSASINWGDGSAPSGGSISGPTGGPFTVNGSHTYAEEGSYKLTVSVVDDGGSTTSASATATVADAKLTASCATPAFSLQAFNGKVATFTDTASPFGVLSDFSANIDWGDSSSSADTVSGPNGGPYTVSGSHTYASTGFFTITTSIKDVGGSTASTSNCKVLIFAFAPGGGSFVIGDQNSATGTSVEFWEAKWAKDNSLSGGGAPHSFKGFAESPAVPACGKGWSTDPGNSTPPPDGPLPAYMGIIVSSSIAQSGPTTSGDTVHIVVVKTDAGYAPNSGHAGTGTVVAQVC